MRVGFDAKQAMGNALKYFVPLHPIITKADDGEKF